MKRTLAAVLLLVAVSFGSSQELPTGIVQGVVSELGTGVPLTGAIVSLQSPDGPDRSGKSDAFGRFRIERVVFGRYAVTVDHDGYYRPGRASGWDTITINPGQILDDVAIRLARGGAISGRVMDEERNPLAGARVEAMQPVYQNGRRVLKTVGAAAETDDNGEYRLFWLKAGKYQVRATYTPRGPFKGAAANGYAPLYYPGARTPDITFPLSLDDGSERSAVDFTMLPINTFRVKGNIVNTVTTDPAAVVSHFYLVPRDPKDLHFGLSLPNFSNAAGEFEIRGVIPGSFYLYPVLTFQGLTYTGGLQNGPASLDVSDENVEGMTLIIQPGQDIRGGVWIEGNTGEPPLTAAGSEIRLIPADGLPAVLTPKPVRANPQGEFRFQNVAAGEYTIAMTGLPPSAYIKSPAGLRVSPGDPGLVRIAVAIDAGSIEGVVVNRNRIAVPNATAVLAPANPLHRNSTAMFKMAAADQNGLFSIRGIPPGDYKLFAWEDVEPGAYLNADFLADVESRGQPVTIAPNAVLNPQCIAIGP